MKRKLSTSYFRGFTLVELLVALMVTSVILAAVASLAYAMGSASDITSDTAQKQAQVRYTTLRISELIRHCKLIYDIQGNDIVIWKSDDNADGNVDASELVYIETGVGGDYIRLNSGGSYVDLIGQCSNASFSTHGIAPPETKRLSVFFDLEEEGTIRSYQISATLHARAEHLLDESGNIVQDDD